MKKFTLLLSAMLLACATSLWAETATLTFSAQCGGKGTDDKANAWTVTSDAAESNFDSSKGIHYGTSSKAVSHLTLTNSTIAGTITKIVVNASGASSTSAKLDVTVGGAAFGSQQSLTATATEYTFEGSAKGEIVVKLSQTSAKKALYVKSIAVTYSTATLQSIEIAGEPTKTTYMAGDAFSTDGLKVMGNYDDDTQKEITTGITWEVTPATLTAGLTSVEVKATVGDKSATRTINSLTVTAPKTLTSIAVSGTPAEFWKGDTFHHDGMTVTATWNDASTTDVTTEAEFSTPDMTTAGTQTVTVTYKEKTATYDITVKTIANTQETAYTVAEAIALIDAGKDLTTEVFVKGIVSEIVTPWSDQYKNITYNISDDGTETSAQFQLFRCLTNGYNVGDAVIAKGLMKKYGTTYEFDAGNEIVAIAENTNPILTCDASVAFGTISSLAGTAPSKTLEVTAKNLTEDITVTLSEDAAFTLSTTTLPAEGGTIEITPVLTIGEHTATLTLTSGETSVKVALSATIKQAYTISWSVNGKVTSTSHVIDGENLVLPTTPEAPNECASKVFVGWATTATVAADGKDIVFVDAATPATADATYYAVFATATESETPAVAEVTFSNMFSDVTSSKDIDGVALVITDGITVTFAKSTSGSNKAQYYDNGKAVRLYGGGSITINSIVTITSFMLTFGDNDGSNALTADCGTWESPTWTGSANTIVLTEEGTTGHRRIAGISVTTKQTTWEEYTTTCTDTPSAIDNATVETSVVKTIENGQLVIMRDGVKYNAMGVRLQ